MKQISLFILSVLSSAVLMFYFQGKEIYTDNPEAEDEENKMIPDYGWFETQRAFPFADIPNEERIKSVEYVKTNMTVDNATRNSSWVLAGPTNIEGRITTLAIDPQNPQVVFAGCANGGVWKSTNFCQSWFSVFDNQNTSSIGALAINLLNPNIIYCGTGEPNSLRSYYPGTGMYKSTNGGTNWTYIGLQNTYAIGNIAINPLNTNELYVAALGALRHSNPERGIYKSTDAGITWTQSLFVADSVGAVDVVLDPSNPSRVFAAMWERTRRENYIKYGGPKSALYLTTNSGQNWYVVAGGFPSNATNLGRISLDIPASASQNIYALLADASGYTMGLYKSVNGGVNWSVINSSVAASSNYAWFNRICKVNPLNANQVFCGGLYMEESTNGGTSFPLVFSSIHVDHHAVAFAPSNTNYIVIGNDGGIDYSTNGGTSFSSSPTLPVTQFYAGDVSNQNPNVLIGGAQDNGCNLTTGSVSGWNLVNGGDGFYCLVDYTNQQFMYASSQNGGLVCSTNGGASFTGATSGLDLTYTNWSTPWIIDKNNPQILYCGTYKVFRSTNRAASWTVISPDLAKAHVANLGTVTTVDVAKSDPNVIYAGTDDANVWVTTNGGTNWTLINSGLPNRWVTRLTVHPDSANLCYVSLSGYKIDSTGAHIFRTTNYGANWTAINGNLPDAPVNDIIIDPNLTNTLYIGTDIGVFVTRNRGQNWSILGGGLPSSVPVHDLTLHNPTRKLVAWTHGRSAHYVNLDIIQSINPGTGNIKGYSLEQNYPNPFNPATTITFSLPKSGNVTIKIYDVEGREVMHLFKNQNMKAGVQKHLFNGSELASGIYFYSLFIDNNLISTRKMVLIK